MQNPQLAELPVVSYPATSFFGALGLTPQIQQGMGAAKSVAKPVNKVHVLVVVALAIAAGYALFHWNEIR